MPGEFLAAHGRRWRATPASIRQLPTALGVGDARDAARAGDRFVPRVPGYIVALLGGHRGGRAGGPAGRDDRHAVRRHPARAGRSLIVPAFRPDLISVALPPALTVAMLGAIESLMSAVVADRMSGDRHNPNVELIAQGVANIVSPLFGGLPATGAIARTATNIRSGAQTPVAGMIHALTLLVRAALRGAARALHAAGGAGRRSCWWSPATWASGARSRELLKLTRPTSASGW